MASAEQQLGKQLVNAGILTQDQLDKVIRAQKRDGGNFRDTIIKLGFTDDDTLLRQLAAKYRLPYVNLGSYMVDDDALPLVPRDLALEQGIVPLYCIDDVLTVAIGDPTGYFWVMENLELKVGKPVKVVLATEDEIKTALKKFYEDEAPSEAEKDGTEDSRGTIEALQSDAPGNVTLVEQKEDENISLEKLAGMGDENSAVNLVNNLLLRALRRRASDLHIEPDETESRVRFRIDGNLFDIVTIPRSIHAPAVARIKIMSQMDISERRLPQDGRFRANVKGRKVDFRVNTMPTIHGERAVMRVLDSSQGALDLAQCGLEDDVQKKFKSVLESPHGIILVTGPTGSGKTTTLYSALSYLNDSSVNIMTAEDPVEYNLAGIAQIQVKPKIGFDFARALEGFLRQDPDVMLVGEIRNLETAQIAVRASLTGHLVLSTLHTNSAAESITRLVDMGMDPYLVSSSLLGIMAQRLVRRICEACREKQDIPAADLKRHGLKKGTTWRGKGCAECSDSGFLGRTVITEFLVLDDDIRELLATAKSPRPIHELAIKKGMKTLYDSAMGKVGQGVTTLEEALTTVGGRPE